MVGALFYIFKMGTTGFSFELYSGSYIAAMFNYFNEGTILIFSASRV